MFSVCRLRRFSVKEPHRGRLYSLIPGLLSPNTAAGVYRDLSLGCQKHLVFVKNQNPQLTHQVCPEPLIVHAWICFTTIYVLGFEVLENIIHCMEQLAVRGYKVRSERKPSPGAGASPAGCVDRRPDTPASVTVGIQLSSLFIRLQAAFFSQTDGILCWILIFFLQLMDTVSLDITQFHFSTTHTHTQKEFWLVVPLSWLDPFQMCRQVLFFQPHWIKRRAKIT